MEKEIIVPKAGLTMTEATVGEWLVSEGELVKKDQPILELMTEKITVEVNAPEDGILASIKKTEGDTVTVGECLAILELEVNTQDYLTVKTSAPKPAAETTNENSYDVAIIGGGPGGYVAAIRAAQLGGKVALIEKQNLGGTCLNVGCIPTKTLLRASELIKLTRSASVYGIFFDEPKVDYSRLMNHKEDVINKLQTGIVQLLKKNRIDVIQGKGKIVTPFKVEVHSSDNQLKSVTARNIIVATGSLPNLPGIPGLREADPMTSNEALSRTELPKSLAIIGAGAIGCEFASIYAPLGVEVTLIESASQILPGMDQDTAKYLSESLKRDGVKILVSTQVQEIQTERKTKILTVEFLHGREKIIAEDILVATGRKPNSDVLGEVGVRMEGSKITVDEQMRTSIPSIFAVGDVNGIEYLAHVASAQGLVAAEACMGIPSKMDYRTVSRCIYTSPEIASVGLNEREAKEQGYEFDIGKYHFESNARALTYGETMGFVKVLREKKYSQILGVHIIGQHASELIGEAMMAIHLEATTEEFALAIHPHPTLSEALLEAILASMDRGIHS
jgi:dihydrolipoamide dehydrogenase